VGKILLCREKGGKRTVENQLCFQEDVTCKLLGNSYWGGRNYGAKKHRPARGEKKGGSNRCQQVLVSLCGWKEGGKGGLGGKGSDKNVGGERANWGVKKLCWGHHGTGDLVGTGWAGEKRRELGGGWNRRNRLRGFYGGEVFLA